MLDFNHESFLFLAEEITLSPYHQIIDYNKLKKKFPDYKIKTEGLIHNLLVSDKYGSILMLGFVLKLNQNIHEDSARILKEELNFKITN